MRMLPALLSAFVLTAPVSAQTPETSCIPFTTALSMAAAFSPDAQVELAQRDEALARLDELRAFAWPQVSLFGKSLAGDADLSDARLANQVGVRLTQDVFDFSKRQLREEAARYDLQSARLLVEASRDITVLEAGSAYLDALKAREQKAALADEVAVLGMLAQALEELSVRGEATADEVLEANARLASMRSQISQLTLVESQAVVTVRLLAGLAMFAPCPSPNLDGELAVSHARLSASDAALQQAIMDHPRVRAAMNAVSARSADADFEKRAWLPTLRGVGTLGYAQDNGLSDWRDRSSVGLEFSMPIFSGGGQSAREGAAVARARQAQKSRDVAALEVEQDLRRAVQAFEFGRVQMESRQSAARFKRDQLKLLRQAYDDRARTLRELVEVQSEFTANELSAIASQYELLSAGLQLYVLSGDSRTRQGR
ncbi:MAG: hypothetical protein EOP61_18615 [Sphingomonadales bacterium]|nr:MAG: hypothetical protein EOP61_18615 [Sphingomonadales bacterium]